MSNLLLYFLDNNYTIYDMEANIPLYSYGYDLI